MNNKQFKQLLETFEEKAENLEEQVLREIEEDELQHISDILYDIEPGKLPFNNIFGDRYRLLMPLPTDNPDKKQFEEVKSWFEFHEYEVDLVAGTATKEIQTKVGPRPRTEKIGKFLGKIAKMHEKYTKAQGEYAHARDNSPEEKVAIEQRDKILKQIIKVLNMNTDDAYYANRRGKEAADLFEFWSKKSDYYRKNPEELEKKQSIYSVVISRHPIDVLRMSDFSSITSCHSPPSRGGENSYWQCAVAEAQGHGPVAFIVDNSELEDFDEQDLQDEEVFRDTRRRINGLEPLTRIRIRKFDNADEGFSLAIPERSIYGKRVPGLQSSLIKFLREKQKREVEQTLDEDNDVSASDFVRRGGEYSDSSSSSMFADFFNEGREEEGLEEIEILGSPGYEHSDQTQIRNEANEYEEACDGIQRRYNNRYKHARVDYDVEDDEHAYVMFSGQIGYEFPQYVTDNADETEIERLAQHFLEKADFLGKYDHAPEFNMRGVLEYSITDQGGDFSTDPDGFEEFAGWVEEIDDFHDTLIHKVTEAFVEDYYDDEERWEEEDEDRPELPVFWKLYRKLTEDRWDVKYLEFEVSKHTFKFHSMSHPFKIVVPEKGWTDIRSDDFKSDVAGVLKDIFHKNQLTLPGIEEGEKISFEWQELLDFFKINLDEIIESIDQHGNPIPRSGTKKAVVDIYFRTEFGVNMPEMYLEKMYTFVQFVDKYHKELERAFVEASQFYWSELQADKKKERELFKTHEKELQQAKEKERQKQTLSKALGKGGKIKGKLGKGQPAGGPVKEQLKRAIAKKLLERLKKC